METELILKLDSDFLERVKAYAAKNKISLSRLFENRMAEILPEKKKMTIEDIEITPFVRSLSSGTSIPSDLDIRKEYGDYITEKYKRASAYSYTPMW